MTIEEAINDLKDFIDTYLTCHGEEDTIAVSLNNVDVEAFHMAIKALEQESCKDAVSRRAVLNTLDFTDKFLDETRTVESYKTLLEECYKNLPSVTPAQKKGKWINKSQKSGCGITFVASECTCCGKKTPFNCDELLYRYCPNCGAEMESEDA